MSSERFAEMVEEAILSLPQDLKAVLRVLEDPELTDEARVLIAGALLHLLSGQNAIPGQRGILGLVDDVLVIRLVLELVEKTNEEAIAQHREDSPELFGTMDEFLSVTRDYLGDLIKVLEGAAKHVAKLNHQGHTAIQCASDDENGTWLYDAVHEAIVEELELDDDEVHRQLKRLSQILPALKSRAGVKP